jgi:hypothetical protein
MLNILMHFEIFHSRIKIYLTFNVEVGMKCNINLLVSFQLVIYFYCTKFFNFCIQLIELDGNMVASIMKLLKKI